MKKIIYLLVALLIVIVAVNYISVSLKKSAKPPQAAEPPELPKAPARVYGIVEPLGREVYLAPPLARTIVGVLVAEGDSVKQGDVLCTLESDLEQEAVRIDRLRVKELEAKIAITQDDLERKQDMFQRNAIAEFDYETVRLQLAYEQTLLQTAKAEINRAETELARLTLRAPKDGMVYKCDLRVGEVFTPQDYRRFVLGSPDKQVRLFVETFWRDRFHVGQQLIVRDAESQETIGKGTIQQLLPYVGARDFRSEDPLERIDVKYQQVIAHIDARDVPMGLLVECELVK